MFFSLNFIEFIFCTFSYLPYEKQRLFTFPVALQRHLIEHEISTKEDLVDENFTKVAIATETRQHRRKPNSTQASIRKKLFAAKKSKVST